MAIILDCLHIVGILLSMKQLFNIARSHLWALGQRFFSCSTRTSSLPAALLFFSVATPFLYSSSLNGDTMEVPASVSGITGRFGLEGMLPLPLTRSWCATWFALTKHGGDDEVGSLESILIVFHA